MEKIITYEGGSMYIINDEYVLKHFRKSTTPMYGILSIDEKNYQCCPQECKSSCMGCDFYNDKTHTITCGDLPCNASDREEGVDCIFVKIKINSIISNKEKYSTNDFKKLDSYRFKISK